MFHGSPIGSDYTAPTWSWASRMAGIGFSIPRAGNESRKYYVKQHVSIIEAQTTLMGADEMGRVSAGRLRLSGPIRWLKDGSNAAMQRFLERIIPDNRSTMTWQVQNSEICAMLFRSCFQKSKTRTESELSPHESSGLILQKGPEKMDGREVFVRVGMFRDWLTDEDILGEIVEPRSLYPSFFADCPTQ